jgi:hypothetical protein
MNEDNPEPTADLIGLTTEIVAAYASSNPLSTSELPRLIADTHAAIAGLVAGNVPDQRAEKPVPAVSIRKSVTQDFPPTARTPYILFLRNSGCRSRGALLLELLPGGGETGNPKSRRSTSCRLRAENCRQLRRMRSTTGLRKATKTRSPPCFLFQPVDEVLHCRSLGGIRQRHRVVCENSGPRLI